MAAQRNNSGKKPNRTKKVHFRLDEPAAAWVAVVGSFGGWEQHLYELKKDRSGIWAATLALEPGRYEYRFLVDGHWRNDPACPEHAHNPYGTENCVLHVPWDAAPRPQPREECVTSA